MWSLVVSPHGWASGARLQRVGPCAPLQPTFSAPFLQRATEVDLSASLFYMEGGNPSFYLGLNVPQGNALRGAWRCVSEGSGLHKPFSFTSLLARRAPAPRLPPPSASPRTLGLEVCDLFGKRKKQLELCFLFGMVQDIMKRGDLEMSLCIYLA